MAINKNNVSCIGQDYDNDAGVYKEERISHKRDIGERLLSIWRELLEVENIGLDDDFYKLGGHSLKAIALEVKIEEEFGVIVTLGELYKNLTVNELINYILDKEENINVSIVPTGKREFYPLTHAQKGVYAIEQRVGPSSSFNMPLIKVIDGKLDIKRLEEAIRAIVQRHASFRTYFELINGEPIQKVLSSINFKIKHIEAKESDLDYTIYSLIQPFALETAPLFRVTVIKVSDIKHILVFDMHHIISDGISIGVLFDEISLLYDGVTLPDLPIEYTDYAIWQSEAVNRYQLKKMEDFWIKMFSGELPKLNIPVDDITAYNQAYAGDGIELILSRELTEDLKQLANHQGITLFSLVLSIFSLLLNKYSNEEDFIIGTIAAGRNHAGLDSIIGMFANMVPIRIKINPNSTFSSFLDGIKEIAANVFGNQEYPIEKLIEHLHDLPYKASYATNPLFGVLINFHTELDKAHDLRINNIKISNFERKSYNSKMDLLLNIYTMSSGELNCTFEFNSKMFKRTTIDKMVERFRNLIKEVIKYPHKRVAEISMISEQEKNQIVNLFNNTTKKYPYNIALHEMIEEQVKNTPNNISIVLDNKKITYGELNRKANQLAWYLKEKGIEDNKIVGVLFERSIEMIIGILAILKAGGAYLPIDPMYPEERIGYMLENSKVSVLLTHSKLESKINKRNCELINVEKALKNTQFSENNLNLPYNPERLMYVLYTSGTTGKPKGVMIKSHSFVNLLYWYTNEFNFSAMDRNLLIAPISFDLAQKNLYASLLKAGSISLYPPVGYNYELMSELIMQQGITVINCTPSAFYPLIDHNLDTDFIRIKSLRCVFLGGEPINMTKLKPWIKCKNNCAEIINTYGPTECTDIVSYYRVNNNVDSETFIPIGKPIYNTNLYVLDKSHNLAPIGVEGELFVGGVGVGEGYHNMQELTEERFIYCGCIPNVKVYKTGDIVRWLPDGNLEFRGRTDHQVKIRGFRIELSEIESCLLQHAAVKEAIVVALESSTDDKYLCAYFVGDRALTKKELREHLLEKLPEYMIPSHFIQLDSMPLNPNGKIDMKKLRNHKVDTLVNDVTEAPKNVIEEELLEIWRDILQVDNISVTDNFFEIGGHSLRAIIVVSKIEKVLGVTVPLNELFNSPTIRDTARYIDNAMNARNDSGINKIDLESIEFNF